MQLNSQILLRQIYFLKTEIETKNEIIKNFIKNDPHRDENNNVPQDGQFRVFTHISNDSDTNLINIVKRNIDEQLKAVREEKHKQYLQNNSRESPSQENIVIETNEKNDRDKTNEQPSDTHNKITNSDINDRDNQCCWPSGTFAIVGDSMINGIDEKRLSQKFGNVKVFDLNHYIVPIIKNKPDYLLLHVGTNDATTNSSRKIVGDLLMLRTNISKQLSNCRIVLSKPTIRHDHGKANLTIRNVNEHLEDLEL